MMSMQIKSWQKVTLRLLAAKLKFHPTMKVIIKYLMIIAVSQTIKLREVDKPPKK